VRSVLAITVLLASFAIASCSPPNQRETTDGILKNVDQDAANWRMYGRAYDDHRFSPLTQINEQTVPGLGLVWSKDLGTTRGLEATPLVENGIIYTTGSWSVVYAYNAKTGERIQLATSSHHWKVAPSFSARGHEFAMLEDWHRVLWKV